MNKKIRLILVAISYMFIVILFSLFYYYRWLNNPSEFIINEEFNIHSTNPHFFTQDFEKSDFPNINNISANETNKLIAPYLDSVSELKIKIDNLSLINKQNKVIDGQNKIELLKSNDDNFIEFLEMKALHYDSIKDVINDSIKILLKKRASMSKNSMKYFDINVKLANLDYRLSLNELNLSTENAKIYEERVKDWTNYYDDSLLNISKIFYDSILKNDETINKYLLKIRDHIDSIRGYADKYYMSRVGRVKYIDFLYFSLVSATSTGYGDILPNSHTIRMLVMFEIVICMVLFALFFYFLAHMSSRKTNYEF